MTSRIRPARTSDLPAMLSIYAAARSFMAANGNPHQWGDEGYPRRELLEEDIALGRSYVVEGTDGMVHGTFMLAPGPDPTYAVIENGHWPDDAPYGVIHRIAGDGRVKGLVSLATAFAAARYPTLRIDTHRDNTAMQGALTKTGYTHCGTIYTYDGTPRLAYHRVSQA